MFCILVLSGDWEPIIHDFFSELWRILLNFMSDPFALFFISEEKIVVSTSETKCLESLDPLDISFRSLLRFKYDW